MYVFTFDGSFDPVAGLLPEMADPNDPRPAREQFAENYVGGWRPFVGFTLTEAGIEYPGDPVVPPLAEARLRDERIVLYRYSWVAIIQPDGSYEISRMD